MERLLEAAATGRVLSVAVECGKVAAHRMRFQQEEGASRSPRPPGWSVMHGELLR